MTNTIQVREQQAFIIDVSILFKKDKKTWEKTKELLCIIKYYNYSEQTLFLDEEKFRNFFWISDEITEKNIQEFNKILKENYVKQNINLTTNLSIN